MYSILFLCNVLCIMCMICVSCVLYWWCVQGIMMSFEFILLWCAALSTYPRQRWRGCISGIWNEEGALETDLREIVRCGRGKKGIRNVPSPVTQRKRDISPLRPGQKLRGSWQGREVGNILSLPSPTKHRLVVRRLTSPTGEWAATMK